MSGYHGLGSDMPVAGPATPDTERRERERADLEALIRRIVREELAARREPAGQPPESLLED